MTSCVCRSRPLVVPKLNANYIITSKRSNLDVGFGVKTSNKYVCCKGFSVRASMVDSYESSSDFVKRMEQAWLISQQPLPDECSTCSSKGHVECKWCGGTGFFILGDNMLCQVPSRNTTCVICAGKGSTCCSDCKGTGFRAKWLGRPPISK